MKKTLLFAMLLTLTLGLISGCQTSPNTEAKKEAQDTEVQGTLKQMTAQDPSLQDFLNKAYGYAVFPTVGKAGLVVGGSFGRGQVFEGGRMVGWADISQATVGAQIGGQSFSEIVAFESQTALEQFKANKLALTANVSAVILKSGAAASAKYQNGVAVFVKPIGGAMVEAAVGGQNFTYQAK